MAGKIDLEKYRPDDLELEQRFDEDPEFVPLWVEWCKAKRALEQLLDRVYSTKEGIAVAERKNKARQVLNEYLNRKGLGHLSV